MANILNQKQAKNLAKKLRLARATTGSEQYKHYSDIERMIKKYGLVIPEFEEIDLKQQTIDSVDSVMEKRFEKGDPQQKRKVFYHYYEWSGWRFYWKAITRLDWKSLFGHVRATYFN